MLAWVLALSVLLQVRAPQHATEILAEGGKVTMRAERMQLSQLLDRMAQKTGMTVTYEGGRPTSVVSLDVEQVSEVEAILKVMEGQGVSFVLKTDPSGEGVDWLIVSGSGAGSLVATNQPSAHVDPPIEEPIEAYSHVPLDPAVLEAAGGAQPPNLNNPYMGLPVQHFPQAAGLPAASPEAPSAPPPPPAPQFPQGSSFPSKY